MTQEDKEPSKPNTPRASPSPNQPFPSSKNVFTTPQGSPTTSRNHPTLDGDNISTTAGDDPPDLMTAPPRPGFPYWKSQFPRVTSVDSDPIFQLVEEQMLDADNSDIESERVENMKKPKKTSGSVKKPKQSSVPIKTSEKTPVQTKKPKKELEVTGRSYRVTRASTVGPHPGKSPTPPTSSSAPAVSLWNVMSQRKIHSERMLHVEEFEEIGIVQLLKKQKLFGTMSKIQPFVKNIVVEFYSNLLKAIKDPRSATFHKVLVCGTKFDFSPTGINVFFESHMESSNLEVDFDKVISELTASVRCLWNNETSFPAADLSLKYSALHKIAVENWLPTFHTTGVHKQLANVLYFIGTVVPFDVGLLIFEEIVSHAEVTSSKPALPFPSFVYGILMSQQNIRTPEDVLELPTKPIRISQKLRECKHVNDVQGENDCNRAEVEGDSVSDILLHRDQELARLTKQEKALAQEQREIAQRNRETAAFLADLLATSSVPEAAPESAPE
ncbi:uncharacterized protein LOC112091154 [Morus notabilis]|uniref:uncharacterized protein LOC112091154 n=1 Tax=Morus notabilis TaxID=981085 RepID=UPI000CED044F|nr:uncharacterized protein LOC112091154 [Morus notabilis]